MAFVDFLITPAQIDKFPCPKCGEDWLYGWEKPSLLKDFLTKQEQWRCAKCKTIFPLSDINTA